MSDTTVSSTTANEDTTMAVNNTFSGVEKTPEVTTTPITRSSPRTPFDFVFRHAASSTAETRYLERTALLHYVRLCLSITSISFGVAVIALEALNLQVYNHTRLSADFYLPLWPADTNVIPTTLPLAAGCVAVFLSLVYLIVAFAPSPRSRTWIVTRLYLIATAISVPLLFATVVYEPVLTHGIFSLLPVASNRPTIQSWTCTLSTRAKNFVSSGSSLGLLAVDGDALNAPDGFSDVCDQARGAFGMVIALFVVSLLAVTVGVAGVSTEKWIEKERMKRYEAEEEMNATEEMNALCLSKLRRLGPLEDTVRQALRRFHIGV